MQIHFTGHQIEVTASLKHFTEDKLNKLERHFDNITSINVVFEVDKLRKIAEATIFVSKGEVHASAESEDMYTSVDLLIDKLNRQLMKLKEKKLAQREHHSEKGEFI